MAFRYREDLVGKRFLSVSGVSKINVNKVSEWGWKAGVIRAASHKDNKNKELQVLVEYDGVDWQRREWVPVYSRRTFRVFLVERTLVWAPRKLEKEEVKWPALTFTPLSADVTLQADAQPVEFLNDRLLYFLDYANLQPYQEWDACLAGSEAGADPATITALATECGEWRIVQDGQRILTSTPSVLGGCRAQVYRVAGATQWYTAVIVGVNEHTGELTVTDDTVLEEHSEDPSLVQMRLLGDGVIESIMRGEVVGVMPRRSRSNLQRVEREATKSPATTSSRKKAAVRSNGQIPAIEPPPLPAGVDGHGYNHNMVLESAIVAPDTAQEPDLDICNNSPDQGTILAEPILHEDGAAIETIDLDPEILAALGESMSDVPDYGESIHDNLSKLWPPLLKRGMPKENKDKLMQEYLIPDNCRLLQAPKLNAEISAAIPDMVRNRDKTLTATQQQLGAGISAINRGLDSLLKEDSKVQALKHLSNACRLLCDSHYLATQTRIKLITPSIDKSFLSLINDSEQDGTLFGSTLSDKIKAARAIEKQGLSIKKAAKPQKPTGQSPSSSRQISQRGNWNAPPRYSASRGGRSSYYRRPPATSGSRRPYVASAQQHQRAVTQDKPRAHHRP